MISIINGKRYDTEKATLVASYSNGYGENDFHHLNEELFVTQNGAWFLHGIGGAATEYAVRRANMRAGSERIRALSEDEAYSWLESHDEHSTLEKHFPERIADA